MRIFHLEHDQKTESALQETARWKQKVVAASWFAKSFAVKFFALF